MTITQHSIRSYRDSDWTRLCAIHDSARRIELRATVGESAFKTLEATAQEEGLFNGEVIVLEAEGAVQGFAAFADGELTWLYVDPTCHRRGFGRALLRHAIGCNGPGFRTEVLEGNPALALYRSEGFEIAERREGKLVGNESFAATGYLLRRP